MTDSASHIATSSIPLSLYIHFPWCIRKCPYCDFNSHTAPEQIPENQYVEALLADLQHDLNWVADRPIGSIFMGGGTPSLFSAAALQDLLQGLQQQLTFKQDIEITLEANPGTVEAQRFADYHAIGINRLSIGVQSFDDHQLQQLGRIHDRQAAIRAAEVAQEAGFDRLNLDLMFGLPAQSIDQAIADLDMAIALKPSHLSWYQLTIEPNTLFYQQPPTLPDDDRLWAMQQAGQTVLADAGFKQYEVSAYSRQQPCQHNLNYWLFGDYLGIGAGAHSKLTGADGAIIRRQRQRHPRSYLDEAATSAVLTQTRALDQNNIQLEFMMNALRLNDGFSLAILKQHTGLTVQDIQPPLQEALTRQLLEHQGDTIRPTPLGQQYLNELLQLFMEESHEAL